MLLVHWHSESSNDSEIYVVDLATLTPAFQAKIQPAMGTDVGAEIDGAMFDELMTKAIFPPFPNMIDAFVDVYH